MNQRASGLGRGLGALIPEDQVHDEAGGTEGLAEVPVDAVEPNRFQPRTRFEESGLDALAASIREVGVLQPILVRPTDDGYELIAGERRWRAARRAGLTTIPALVKRVADRSSLEEAVIENLHRQDLNALEEAAAYQHLIDEFDLTQDRVAERVGKSRPAVTNTLRLLGLPGPVQRLLLEDHITAGHARALLAAPDDTALLAYAKRVVDEDLTVRQTEQMLKGEDPTGPPPPPPPPPTPEPTTAPAEKNPALLELESRLEEQLSTRVRLAMGANAGSITISFADLDDLERIYRLLQR